MNDKNIEDPILINPQYEYQNKTVIKMETPVRKRANSQQEIEQDNVQLDAAKVEKKGVKICIGCRMENSIEAYFCRNCGQANWETEILPESVAEPEKKKMATWKRVLIWLGLVVLLVIVRHIVLGALDNYFNDITSDDAKVEYTPGIIDGSTYTNEWAEFQITLPESYVENESARINVSIDKTECCMYYISTDGTSVSVLVEDLKGAGRVDEEQYFELMLESMEQSLDQYAAYNPKVSVEYEKEDVELAGRKYYCGVIKMEMEVSGVQNVVYEKVYVRKIDSRMIGIIITGRTTEYIENIAQLFEAFEE